MRILVLSGGGMLGIYTLRVLERIEEYYRVSIYDKFDFICGTSAGGIITLGLVSEMPLKKLSEEFERIGKDIFRERGFLRGIVSPNYSNEKLKQHSKGLLGDKRVRDIRDKIFSCPSFNYTRFVPEEIGNRSFNTNHDDFFLWEVACATSAAPTFFPFYAKGEDYFVDGGVYLNNPSLHAILLAKRMGTAFSSMRVLNIGTTYKKTPITWDTAGRWGVFQWLFRRRLLDVMLSSQEQLALYEARNMLKGRFLSVNSFIEGKDARSLNMSACSDAEISRLRYLADQKFEEIISHPRRGVELRGMLEF